ncbi:hypothetical protein Fleli_3227 [Bernardetia litoralis DSM 6794]|uniref:Outer membrane protein beta-barrel domain-containing protein n=1 Tax=Bernardetia litoralis (strain ATCC 23117 / DSM 6794 / NBRC 15988 / NCIMB 1366 / Fx l1 / Sio-4) TaxID=880071 RepID=I4ANM3_BERLS|nr:hypothetical protein [Bernardetia litoralis]AFM05558.1 hypothetical protein Fleli_3227 [Bernardetia litoralis DSM 6794]
MTNKLFQSVLLAFTLFFVGTSTSFAQDNTPDESISYGAFTLYGNFPLDEDFKDQAKFGGGLGFEGAYFFHPLVGFAYSLDAQVNPYNKEANETLFTGVEDAQPWVYGNLMGGLELSFPITPIIAPEFRVLGGLMVARAPEVTGTVVGFPVGTVDAVTSPAFAYSVSGGLKFTNYDSGSAFRVGVRYLAATPKFDYGNDIEQKINMSSAQLYVSFAFLSRK